MTEDELPDEDPVVRERWDGLPKCTDDALEKLEHWGRETARGKDPEAVDPLLVVSAVREVRRLRAAVFLAFDATNSDDVTDKSARIVTAAVLATVKRPQ